MYLKPIVAVFFGSILASLAYAQTEESPTFIKLKPNPEIQSESDGVYAMEVQPDGNIGRVLVPLPDSSAERALNWYKDQMLSKSIKQSGLEEILDSGVLEDLGKNCQPELLPNQQKEIKRILESFAVQMRDAAKHSTHRIRAEHFRQIQSILLPEQLDWLSKKMGKNSLVITPLLSSKVSEELKLTDAQRSKILARCKVANPKIKAALDEQRKILSRFRDELKAIYADVLTDDQKNRLESQIPSHEILRSMSLDDIYTDTAFE